VGGRNTAGANVSESQVHAIFAVSAAKFLHYTTHPFWNGPETPDSEKRSAKTSSRALKLLDRYVLRSFFEPFLLCFFGFLGIWLVFDLSDNLPDFLSAKTSFKLIAGFYLTQLPAIILIVLPVGLLLGLLFSLSRMSRTNELMAQLTAGRSVSRVLLPLFGVGLICSAFLIWLSYELAPHSEGIKKVALDQIQKGKKKMERDAIEAHLFKDRENRRTWYVRKLRPGSTTLDGVLIIQQDPDGNIIRKWYADRAEYDSRYNSWQLKRGMAVEFDVEGNEIRTDRFFKEFRTISTWSETPERIASSNSEPQNLSIPELRDYLRMNFDFSEHALAPYRCYLEHRQAYGWAGLVAVLVGGPLGIGFSRRGIIGGIAAAIFIFVSLFFLNDFFLALGKGGHLSARAAAWTPTISLAAIGLIILYFRSSNRELPRLLSRRR
jgi:LPS export ABC transporter permease LptG